MIHSVHRRVNRRILLNRKFIGGLERKRILDSSKKNRATFVSNYTVFQRYIMHISFEFPRAPEFFIPMMVSLVEDFIFSSLQEKSNI